jgi:hypothetical protein
MTKKATKNLKASLICLGLVTISAIYVSAFTNSMASESKSIFNVLTGTKTVIATITHIGTTTSIGTSTGTTTSIGTSTGIGTQTNDGIKGINIYPNPVVDKLNIKYSQEAAAVTKIKVLDVAGACVYLGEKTDIIDMSKFSAGTYFVQFIDINLHTTTKSIVKVVGQ